MKSLLSVCALMLASALSAVTLNPLVPGKDYTKLTVSGTSEAAVTVKLVDRSVDSEPVSALSDFSVQYFSADFTGLEPGHEYAVFIDGVEMASVVMSREMTEGWLYENNKTYAGEEPGTGVWSGDGESSVKDGRIVIAAELGDDSDQSVVYLPTNHFGEASGYRVDANIAFDGEASAPRSTDGIFGITLVVDPNDSSRAVFYIVDGQGWKRTDIVGNTGFNYNVEFLVDEVNRRVNYYILGNNERTHLGCGAIPAGVPTRFRSVDFQGFGSISVLEGEASDTQVVGIEVHLEGDFSNGVVRAGTNFTNLYIEGWVKVSKLWETGTTSGKIETRVVGSDGVVLLAITNDWSGFSGTYGITNLIDGLTRGDDYRIEVNVLDGSGEKIDGEASWSSRGIMGRETDAWYDEDAYTVSGQIPSTGVWKLDDGIALTADASGVVLVSTDGTTEDPKACFTPTNAVRRNGQSCVNSFEASFGTAMNPNLLPDASGELFGLSMVDDGGEVKLAVIVNGVWKLVDRSVYAPELGRMYVIDAVCSQTDDGSRIEYFVTDEAGIMHQVASGSFRAGSKPYPADVSFRGDGRFASATGKFFDTTLFNVDFDVTTETGTNFTEVAISSGTGILRVTPVWDTTCSNGTVRVVVRNGHGEIVKTVDAEFHGDTPVYINVDGLEPGDTYAVSAYVIKTDGPADGDVELENIVAPTAKRYSGKWIDEDASTFDGTLPSTGDWSYRLSPSAEAWSTNDLIRIEADLSSSVTFEATNQSQTVENSTIRELTFEICSKTPGYKVSSPVFPSVRPADLAGITIVRDDTDGDKLHFSVYNCGGLGSWHILSNTVAALDQTFSCSVIIAYPNPYKTTASSVRYYLNHADGTREQIAVFEPGKKTNGTEAIPEITDAYRTRLRFVGSGSVKGFEGECYDAHLAEVAGVEYWTVEDAVREIASSGRILKPLWFSTYVADTTEGWFGVDDPDGWLNLLWPLGYVVEITDRGDAMFYLFHLSDNWIDWAIAEDAVATMDGWEVTSANGLAWLAKESSTNWINGTVTLGADITNLYEHIWTPIRGFTGTFDGKYRKIVGLTDKGASVCTTNDLGMTAYGLFGTASNSVFRSVYFDRVAVSNSADAVAALLGCSVGDVELTNVVIRSGSLAGGGTFVSGIVGYMGDFDAVSVRKNFNAAEIKTINAPLGGTVISGIANLGLDAATGSVSVVENENRGSFETTVNSTIGGGNVAQIVAGGESTAQFDPDAVNVTGNIGTGDVSRVTSLGHDGWPAPPVPVVNLAAEVSRQDDDSYYSEYIEANDSSEVLIDPWRLTARMTGANYQNGGTNYAGRISDLITASKPGDTVTLPESCETWSPIVLDRAITLELDGKVVDNAFDGYTFEVTDDAGGALVRNGTVTHPEGKLATRPVGDQWYMDNVNTFAWNTNYWDRGIFIDGEFVDSILTMSAMLTSAAVITPVEDSGFTVNAKTAAIEYNGQKAFSLAPQGYKITDNGDGSYTIEIDDDPATLPTINFTPVPVDGEISVTLTGTRADCEYCLQSVSSLAEEWDKPTDVWKSVENDGDGISLKAEATGDSGFYRIKARRK